MATSTNFDLSTRTPEQIHTAIFKTLKDMFRLTDSIEPILLMMHGDGRTSVLAIAEYLRSAKTKDHLASILRNVFTDNPSLYAYALVHEAWLVEVKEADLNKDITPSKHPDRQEVVTVLLRYRDIPLPYIAHHKMQRKGKKVILHVGEVQHDGIFGGRFLDGTPRVH